MPKTTDSPGRRRNAAAILVGALLALGLQPDPAGAIGGQIGLEFAIDAPWRLEPAKGGAYGPIPIVITFHDAIYERRGGLGEVAFENIVVGKFTEALVEEQVQGGSHLTRIPPEQLREIERKQWISTQASEPLHENCRPFLGEKCDFLLDISQSHEWHAMLWYTPKAVVTPGRNVHLVVTVKTNANGQAREWVNSLVVHAGEEPLPRFGDQWLYGDLHYHSQMTDNEGESAYSYRNVVRALGAMGMDFVFATDHASNSTQVDGAMAVRRCGSVEGTESLCPIVGMNCRHRGQKLKCAVFKGVEARDLNPARFAAAKQIMYGADGANQAVARDADTGGLARFRSAGILPQIYLGEELDAWPEMSAREREQGFLTFGNGLSYFWYEGGGDCRDPRKPHDLSKCRAEYTRRYSLHDHRSFLLLDEQGIPVEETLEEELPGLFAGALKLVTADGTHPYPSRQHLIYLPRSSALTSEGFIGSNTKKFGGAGKRLEDILREVEAGGYAFLAHPLANASAGSNAGPDLVPYSDKALDRAWRSPGILGLQLWNENDRRIVGPRQSSDALMDVGSENERFLFPWPFLRTQFPWTWRSGIGTIVVDRELSHGTFTWDRYLRKGLVPAETAELPWLPKGMPRKWFMAGGSDAHGDLNYRRQGRPCLARWCDVPVSDTAIGKPRNLVQLAHPPNAGRFGNRQVIDALRAGQFTVTDGPALRIAIDTNASGKIEDTDMAMGGTFNLYPGEHVPLLVEWKSTREFGAVDEIQVYVGNALVTFAPDPHGPLGAPTSTAPGAYHPDPSGALKISLKTAPLSSAGFHGVARLFLSPKQLRLAAAGDPLFYVRAEARTSLVFGAIGCPAGERCASRLAFSNPIWGRYHARCPATASTPPVSSVSKSPSAAGALHKKIADAVGAFHTVLDPGPGRSSSRDQDGNGVPDTCERDVPNPCPAPPSPSGTSGLMAELTGEIFDDTVSQDIGQTGTQVKPPPPRSCQIVAALGNPNVLDAPGNVNPSVSQD